MTDTTSSVEVVNDLPDTLPAQKAVGVGLVVPLFGVALASHSVYVQCAAVAGVTLIGIALLFHEAVVRVARNKYQHHYVAAAVAATPASVAPVADGTQTSGAYSPAS